MFMVNNILVTDNQMFITFTNKNKKLMKLTFLPIFVYSDFSEWTHDWIYNNSLINFDNRLVSYPEICFFYSGLSPFFRFA